MRPCIASTRKPMPSLMQVVASVLGPWQAQHLVSHFGAQQGRVAWAFLIALPCKAMVTFALERQRQSRKYFSVTWCQRTDLNSNTLLFLRTTVRFVSIMVPTHRRTTALYGALQTRRVDHRSWRTFPMIALWTVGTSDSRTSTASSQTLCSLTLSTTTSLFCRTALRCLLGLRTSTPALLVLDEGHSVL